ncbi:HlyD family secretion protein [Candidatus Latescibacterota bacterium]
MKHFIFIGIAALVVIIFVFSPVKIPYTLEVAGKIYAHKEWIVSRNRDDLLTAVFHDNARGMVNSYFVTVLERGDALRFILHRSIVPGFQVSKGDTVGWIDSSTLRQQLSVLNGLVRTQKAILLSAKAGEKESIVEEARKNIEYARAQLEEQKKIVERQKNLYETEFSPYQDYEIALSTMELYAVNVELAEAQLQSVLTGVKKEEIDIISARITSLEEEIDTLLERLEAFILISPLSGMVLDTMSDSTIVNIADLSAYIAILPLKLQIREFVRDQQSVEFEFQGRKKPYRGKIEKLGNVISFHGSDQVVIAKASIETDDNSLLPGAITMCRIVCEPITLYEYLLRALNIIRL